MGLAGMAFPSIVTIVVVEFIRASCSARIQKVATAQQYHLRCACNCPFTSRRFGINDKLYVNPLNDRDVEKEMVLQWKKEKCGKKKSLPSGYVCGRLQFVNGTK